ncbi:MAG: glycosyltransferase family 4 protein [Dorea sp.]|nr:glycosyltransferase family 4 protein [Dorea sp.]
MKELEQLISIQTTVNERLEVVAFIGKMYAEYVTGVYASDVLEKQIVECGQNIEFSLSNKPRDKHILIVMTECGEVGGHTVLVHNWIDWDDENQYSIVFTDMNAIYIPKFIKKVVKKSGGKMVCLSGSYMEKATKLLEISKSFQRILLFNHMEDIIPILAYGNRNWKIPVYFYNHADFKFSYGFSVADIVLNLYEFDVDKTIRFRGVHKKNSVYLQFPGQGKMDGRIEKQDKKVTRAILEQKYGIKKDEKLIVSMGADFKYENIIGFEFDSYVREVLKRCSIESSFLIIGADRERDKWIRLKKKTGGKAQALGILSRTEAVQIISAADLYVASFPMVASGMTDAEQSGVPCLILDIYGRCVESKNIGVSESVEELIIKTLDILEGNKDKYLQTSNINVWTKHEWKKKWHAICNDITEHELHLFHPQRMIEKQEYVNCQLMQREAAQTICTYIGSHHLNESVKREIFKIEQKYDMGINSNYINYLERKCYDLSELSDKHLQLYLTLIKWMELKQEGKRIDKYLCQQGCNTVAIYGMSYMGNMLYKELKNSLVDVVYGIDRNAEQLYSEIPIFKPSDKHRKVNIIINTTSIENSEILEKMNVNDIKMLQLDDLLDLIHEE